VAKPRLEPIDLLSAVAGRARRVLLGSSWIASFIVRHPIVLANQWAGLDQVSDGRAYLVACMGGGPNTRSGLRSPSGAKWDVEFAAMQVAMDERAGRLMEGIDTLRRLWTGQPTTHEGRYYRFRDVGLNVRPVRDPCPT